MQAAKDLILDDYYKLRIISKRLNSGRYQVKFFATVKRDKKLYGYVLVEADETLKSVIGRIRKRLKVLEASVEHRHFHLFNVGRDTQPSNLMIFQ